MWLLFDVALLECAVCRPGSLLSHNAAIMIPIALFCLNAFFIAGVECQSQDTGTGATPGELCQMCVRCHLVTSAECGHLVKFIVVSIMTNAMFTAVMFLVC